MHSTIPFLPSNGSFPAREDSLLLTNNGQSILNRTPRILIIHSVKVEREFLRSALERVGYEVYLATSGVQGLQLYDQEEPIDLILLEVATPGVDGYTVCTELRRYSHVPIVLLSDLNRIDQIVQGFSVGADDYITKPYSFPVLEARLAAILRRTAAPDPISASQAIAIDEIVLNTEGREVSVRNQTVSLSPIEYSLLRYLMHMVDRPVSKQELFQNVWGYFDHADVNLVRVGVHRLREKIEKNPNQPTHVLTVPGYGYKFQTLQMSAAL